jgi:uroporphyrinogen-III synthase
MRLQRGCARVARIEQSTLSSRHLAANTERQYDHPRMTTRVIVTRPERDAHRWVVGLREVGFDALALPLIDIGPAPDRAAVERAWLDLDGCIAAMFVSGNAAQQFLAARPAGASAPLAQPGHARAWATGPGTRQALIDGGVPALLIDAPASDAPQFDSEALWAPVATQAQPGSRVLIVRGADAASASDGKGVGRDWFAAQLTACGCTAQFVVAYARRAPQFDAAQLEQVRAAASDGSVWLFSSSEAIANLMLAMPGQQWVKARAVATHPRIAQAARDAGFAVVCESRPALPDVVASIESIA